MRKERKEYLLGCFPALPTEIEQQMQGKKSANFVVLLTNGNELFARCYHRYSKGELIERQRYVFAKDGAVRYGKDDGRRWTIRSEFREPVFCRSTYGYTFDNSYIALNIEVIKNSCMRYSCAESYRNGLLITKLALLTQVNSEDRAEVMADNDLSGMTVSEIKTLIEKVKRQGEQLSMFEEQLSDKAKQEKELSLKSEEIKSLQARLDDASNEIQKSDAEKQEAEQKNAELEARIKEFESRPVEVTAAEPEIKEVITDLSCLKQSRC